MSKKLNRSWTIAIIVLCAIILSIALVWILAGWSGVSAIGTFISDQLLGMAWLNSLVGLALSALFGNWASGTWGSAVQFFVYDTIKILLLLCILIFSISYIQSYFPPERTRRILGGRQGITANIFGALLGTVTPFCSCSSIPIFMGFSSAGLSSGVTFSFLISSPLVDIGALILLTTIFGLPIAICYVVVGLLLAVVGGTIIDKSGMGVHVQDYLLNVNMGDTTEDIQLTKTERAIYARDALGSTLKKVWPYILVGVGIGAVIHNFIPTEWVQAVLGQDKWYSVLVASVVGVPMYADIFGTIPIAEALFAKGVGVGTILAFMMSVTALSLPSMIMLSKAVKPKLLATFIAIVVVGIIIIGYLFNAIGYLLV